MPRDPTARRRARRGNRHAWIGCTMNTLDGMFPLTAVCRRWHRRPEARHDHRALYDTEESNRIRELAPYGSRTAHHSSASGARPESRSLLGDTRSRQLGASRSPARRRPTRAARSSSSRTCCSSPPSGCRSSAIRCGRADLLSKSCRSARNRGTEAKARVPPVRRSRILARGPHARAGHGRRFYRSVSGGARLARRGRDPLLGAAGARDVRVRRVLVATSPLPRR